MTLPSTESLLTRLGWDDGWEAAFAEHRAAGLAPARVAIQHRGAYDLMAEEGELRASAATRLVKADELPAVGDWVGLDPRDRADRGRARTPHGDLAQGGLARDPRAGARGEHRRRVPRAGAAARLQRAPTRAVPRDGVGERSAADRAADEDRPRRRRDAVPRRGRGGHARLVPDARGVGAHRRGARRRCGRGSSRTARPSCSARPASASRRSSTRSSARSCSRRRRCARTTTAAATRRRTAS